MGILIVYNEPTTSQVRQAKSRRHGGSGHLAGGCYDLRAEKDSALGARTDNKKALTGKIEVTLLSNRRRKAMAGRVFFLNGFDHRRERSVDFFGPGYCCNAKKTARQALR